jgi:hypothetical protein
MKRMESTMPAISAQPSSAGDVMRHDLRRALTASIGFGAGMLLIVCVVAIVRREWAWDWLSVPLIAAAIPLLLVTIGALAELVRAMIVRIESITGVDVNQDGVIGAPPPRFVAINPYAGRAALERDAAERDRTSLEQFIRGCAVDTSLRRWEPSIGRDCYQEYRDRLIDSGWAEWKRPGNERAGWVLTATPEATIAGLWT